MKTNIRNEINRYCEKLGSNRLFVQGAGGNISWKDSDNLWIKASGMWLIDAPGKNIFVPVDLIHILQQVQNKNYSFDIKSLEASDLRPSIETILHAILPHKIVLHIHAVEILALLVNNDYEKILHTYFADKYICGYVDYKKPGPELAREVNNVVNKRSNVQIIFLQNHGIVVGGNTINEIDLILKDLISTINNSQTILSKKEKINYLSLPKISGYEAIKDSELHNLAIDYNCYQHVLLHWPLYPDHVVFLNMKPFCYDCINDFLLSDENPDLLFIKNIGVYVSAEFSLAKEEQLRCFYDVIIRIRSNYNLNILDQASVEALINWDSEQYRINNAK